LAQFSKLGISWTGLLGSVTECVRDCLDASNESAVERGKIRRVLSLWTGQELVLK